MNVRSTRLVVGPLLAILLAACGATASPPSPPASAPQSSVPASTSVQPAPSSNAPSPAAAPASAASPQTSKIVIGVAAFPATMDPTASLSAPDFYGEALVMDALTKFEYNGQTPSLQPALGLSWSAKDTTTWEFKLRANVKFQNGDPFTADDVTFTINRALDPANKLPTAARFASIKSVAAVDPLTVDIVTKDVDPLLPGTLSTLRIVPAKYFQAVGADVFAHQKPVGTGWYKVTSFDSKGSLTLDSFDTGWHGPAKTKTVVFQSIPEESSRVAALKSGSVDMVTALNTDDVAPLQQAFNVIVSNHADTSAVYFQSEGPKAGPMTDQRVRKAMIQAVDKDSIAKNIMAGLVKPAVQSVGPDANGFNPAITQEPYDLNKAKSLLADAGVKGFDIAMGATYGSLTNTQDVAEAFVGMESKIGVNVKVQNMDTASFLGAFHQYVRPPLWDMSLSWAPNMDASVPMQFFLSSRGPDKFMDSPDFDKLVAAAGRELDPAKRTKDLQDAEAIMVNQDIGVWFFESVTIFASSKNMQGFTPRPDETIEVFNMSKGAS